MQLLIIKILIVSCTSLIIVELSGIIQSIKYSLSIKRMKPFDCLLCFSFWFGLIFSLSTYTNNYEVAIITTASPILSLLIFKQLTK